MKYVAPYGSGDPNAPYINGDPSTGQMGSIPPAPAFEHPLREIVAAIMAGGQTPDETKLNQLALAIQSGKSTYAVATGTANAWTVAPSLDVPAYAAGRVLWIIAPATNTLATVTASISGLGGRNIKRSDGTELSIGDLVGGDAYMTIDDGTNIRVLSRLPSQMRANALNLTVVTYTSGSGNFIVPAGVTAIEYELVGGGGGGGYAAVGGAGAGGNGADTVRGTLAVTPGQSIAYVVGAAGGAGNVGTSAQPGGATTFGSLSARPGAAGSAAAANNVGSANSNTGTNTGQFILQGQQAEAGFVVTASSLSWGGHGGACAAGGTGGNGSRNGGTTGNPGIVPGGGGGGGASTANGGAGASGQIILKY